jgi:hypothetical protein
MPSRWPTDTTLIGPALAVLSSARAGRREGVVAKRGVNLEEDQITRSVGSLVEEDQRRRISNRANASRRCWTPS